MHVAQANLGKAGAVHRVDELTVNGLGVKRVDDCARSHWLSIKSVLGLASD